MVKRGSKAIYCAVGALWVRCVARPGPLPFLSSLAFWRNVWATHSFILHYQKNKGHRNQIMKNGNPNPKQQNSCLFHGLELSGTNTNSSPGEEGKVFFLMLPLCPPTDSSSFFPHRYYFSYHSRTELWLSIFSFWLHRLWATAPWPFPVGTFVYIWQQTQGQGTQPWTPENRLDKPYCLFGGI